MPMKLGFIQEVKAEALSFFEKAKEYVKRRRNRRVVILASLGFLVLLGF
jgi:hypothetical protein